MGGVTHATIGWRATSEHMDFSELFSKVDAPGRRVRTGHGLIIQTHGSNSKSIGKRSNHVLGMQSVATWQEMDLQPSSNTKR